MNKKTILTACFTAALSLVTLSVFAQPSGSNLPMDRVYQGRIQLPDFKGRDSQFSTFRTRIANEMRTGPNFAGHYALVEIGCGTGCRFVVMGDVATGQVFPFPYGGEEYNMLDLKYQVKQSWLSARWTNGGRCYGDVLEWTGTQFSAQGRRLIGPETACNS